MKYDKWKINGVFELSNGEISKVYYDLKEMMGDPKLLQDEIKYLRYRTKWEFDIIVGIDYGGVPLAIGLSLFTGTPYAVLRKEQKQYGMKRRIEGSQIRGRTLLLDDVSTTGNSITEAVEYLENNGYNVVDVVTLLDRRNEK